MNFYFIDKLSVLFISIIFFLLTVNLFSQDIFIDDICTCSDGTSISEFIVTFDNWPNDNTESFDIIINYSEIGGDRTELSASGVPGDSSGFIKVIFSGVANAVNTGDIQISSVLSNSANTSLPTSPDFIPYQLSIDVSLTVPSDTIVSSCSLGNTEVNDFFDSWLSEVSASGGCGDIEISNDWNGTYPDNCGDSVTVEFTAIDPVCGNTVVSSASFTVIDCTNPTPVVINGLVSAEVTNTLCVDVNIDLFDAGSFDDCGDVTLSFSSDVSDTLRTFCCEVNNDIREVEFWVTDKDGNQDFTVTFIEIKGCHSHGLEISGKISTEDNRGVQGVEVFLEDSTSMSPSRVLTGINGAYIFQGLEPFQSTEYSIRPYKNDDILNGVNTLDILYIQQHILGLNPIENPYVLIASNVNDDARITGADLIELRRAILGVGQEFDNNTSWRFVDATEILEEGEIPRDYSEEISVSLFNNNRPNQDFIAIKIGDVNGTVATNINDEDEDYSGSFTMIARDKQTENDHRVELEISSEDFREIQGFQLALDYGLDTFEFLELESGVLDMEQGNYADFKDRGILTMSWNGSTSVSRGDDDVLFTLVFRVKTDVYLRQNFHISDEITASEAYARGKIKKIKWKVDQEFDDFALLQNVPNPFKSQTIIGFEIPENGPASITFYDATGKIVYSIIGEYAEGYNQVAVKRADLPMKGLYYYELCSGSFRATKKMVVIR